MGFRPDDERLRTALDQLAKGDQIAVDSMPKPEFKPDARRASAAEKTVQDLNKVAEKVRAEEGISPLPESASLPDGRLVLWGDLLPRALCPSVSVFWYTQLSMVPLVLFNQVRA